MLVKKVINEGTHSETTTLRADGKTRPVLIQVIILTEHLYRGRSSIFRDVMRGRSCMSFQDFIKEQEL